jgi:POT family proton-dependent oligopeptide transporter
LKNSPYRTAPDPDLTGMPRGIPYIVGNEAAERFSFYGMKAALVIFMARYLHLMGNEAGDAMSEAAANEYTHYFVMAVYASPLLGAILSDAFTGKYRTIIWLSIVYCIGHACLAFIGLQGVTAFWLVSGLAFIALGAGGIKPCVSAHVGDQFGRSNQHRLTTVFNLFYLSINFGASISNLLIPWVLAHHGPHWAFGVPGVLMAAATIVFWMGRREFVHVPPAGRQFVKETFSLRGIFALGKLFILFLFVAVFWALFDQTATSWVFQAENMDRQIGPIRLLPSQIQAINPFLILVLIPLFAFLIYPAVGRFIKLTPLRKIGTGLLLMTGAFAIVAWTQERIDAGQTPSIGWQALAYVILTTAEILVSIVSLEFAYTQAPRTMKSFMMSIYLLSVSFGNLFTAQVNRYIQIPAIPVAAEAHPGFDGLPGTADDLTAVDGSDVIESPARETLSTASERILRWTAEHDRRLPNTEEGTRILEGINDPWGGALRYRLLNRREARISSDGPDRAEKTRWDLGALVAIPVPLEEEERPWLEGRKRILGVGGPPPDPDAAELPPSVTYTAGGGVKLEGAAYFWFFTKLMLGTAILFVPYACLYRGKTILQD